MKNLVLLAIAGIAVVLGGCTQAEEPAEATGPKATDSSSVGEPVSSGAAVGETSAVKGEGGPAPRTPTGE